MTTITITRHHSGFDNRADRYELGDHEHVGNASVGAYALPAGYTCDDGVVRDPKGWQCEIVPASTPDLSADKGGPVLMSPVGSVAL